MQVQLPSASRDAAVTKALQENGQRCALGKVSVHAILEQMYAQEQSFKASRHVKSHCMLSRSTVGR